MGTGRFFFVIQGSWVQDPIARLYKARDPKWSGIKRDLIATLRSDPDGGGLKELVSLKQLGVKKHENVMLLYVTQPKYTAMSEVLMEYLHAEGFKNVSAMMAFKPQPEDGPLTPEMEGKLKEWVEDYPRRKNLRLR